jgi:outer membrane murein-binding lipoprotein Lpp
MNTRPTGLLALVAICVLVLADGCTTGRSRQTAAAVEDLQARVEDLEASNDALTRELLGKQGKYIVRRGDTLTLIAERFNLKVRDILHMNPDLATALPGKWKPGLVIVVRVEKPNKAD